MINNAIQERRPANEFYNRYFSQFDRKWALLSAGTKDDHNSMTISWGGMGTLWHKPVVTVYVKPLRYTYEFMNKNDVFTVSFYLKDPQRILHLLQGGDEFA